MLYCFMLSICQVRLFLYTMSSGEFIADTRSVFEPKEVASQDAKGAWRSYYRTSEPEKRKLRLGTLSKVWDKMKEVGKSLSLGGF